MKKGLFLSLICLLSVFIAGPASATHFDDLVLSADCEAWGLTGGITLAREWVTLTYVIELYEGSTVIEQYTGNETFYRADGYYPDFAYNGMWSSELCGEYTAKAVLELTNDEGFYLYEELVTSFICECPPPSDECTGTPGYWKNHRDMWPVDELMVGGQLFTKMELIEIFNWPANQFKQIKLFHHLVAAKLNFIKGATYEGIEDAISAADDFLAMYPLGSEIDNTARKTIDGLKAPLEMFNESAPCGETIDSYDSPVIMFGASPDDEKDEKSWGGIKNIYKK